LAKKIFEVSLNLKNFLLRRRRKGNPSAKRAFLKNLGSNLVLKDRNLLFSTKKPFFLVTEKGLKGDWLPDKGRFPNFSIELFAGLNNSKNDQRWSVVY